MRKLISISVALALLVTFMVPAVVTADWYGEYQEDPTWPGPQPIEDPGNYSKTPFGIFGAGIQLLGFLITDLEPIVEGAGVDLPFELGALTAPFVRGGAFVAGPVAWMTDMTAWFMVLLGDVIQTAGGLVEGMGVDLPFELDEVADIFYVVAARMLDEWGALDGILGDLPPRLGP